MMEAVIVNRKHPVTTTTIPRTPAALAEALGMNSVEPMRKFIVRHNVLSGTGQRFNSQGQLELAQVRYIVETYAESRNEETADAARELIAALDEAGAAQTLGTTFERLATTAELVAQGSQKATTTRSTPPPLPKKSTGYKPETLSTAAQALNILMDVLLGLIACTAMGVQIINTAVVVGRIDPVHDTQLGNAHAWGFALAVQFTGLVLTLYKGRRVYLAIFAVAEFLINLFYFKPWVINTIEIWVSTVLLSAVISFTIYSYAEVFAARRLNNATTNH